MTILSFPILPGQAWSVHKKPMFSTRVVSHSSGREVRSGFYSFPKYEFELQFDGLDSSSKRSGLQFQSLQTLMGFFLSCGGQRDSFLYSDPTDNLATSQTFGTGDGVKTSFVLVKNIGGFIEPANYVNTITNVKINGVNTTSYTFNLPNIITFNTAPAVGSILVVSFSYSYECRFLEDQLDFENIMNGLWQVKSVKFRSLK